MCFSCSLLYQGQQRFAPSPYNNPTGGRHLENYEVSKYAPESGPGERNSLMLNGQINQSLDNASRQNFASGPRLASIFSNFVIYLLVVYWNFFIFFISQNTDQVYDYNRANSRFEDAADDNYFQPSPMNDGVDSYALEGNK